MPVAIDPTEATCLLERLPGFTSCFILRIILKIDSILPNIQADPGSRQWLMTQALSAEDDNQTSNDIYRRAKQNHLSPAANDATTPQHGEYPEDKFHIQLPDDVDKYTGLKLPENSQNIDDFEFPEDRFHRQDAASSYIIQQREQALKDKQLKSEK